MLWQLWLGMPTAAAAAAAFRLGPDTGYAKARCLDGSPGLYYFSPGSGDGINKFFIFHEGGGWCGSDTSFLERSKGNLGSTKSDPEQMDFEALGNLKFSRDPTTNPLMYNWNHAFLRYCDGGYYSGQRDEPKMIQKNPIFYRGRYITEALFNDLTKNFGFANSTDVVISGCSAGAMRVFAHLDALRSFIPASAKVVGLADSGYYMDVNIFTPLKRYVVTEQNATALLNQECLKTFEGQEEKCLVGSVIAGYLKTPIFAFQSRFDSDQRSCEMGPLCRLSTSCVKAYAGNLSQSLEKTLQHPHGYFLDSCVRHCFFDNLAPKDATGIYPLQAFATWYGGGLANYSQESIYPCPGCCNTDLKSLTI